MIENIIPQKATQLERMTVIIVLGVASFFLLWQDKTETGLTLIMTLVTYVLAREGV